MRSSDMELPLMTARMAQAATEQPGRPWAVTGPLFGFSSTWQPVINSATLIVTFVMVFLIHGAKNDLMALGRESEETLNQVKAELSAACENIGEATAASRSE